ncbi:MAG: hypothetical protein LAT67_12375 [Balneolales bacterium]|nr:hypothetical protein [Balneolales bacterium]
MRKSRFQNEIMAYRITVAFILLAVSFPLSLEAQRSDFSFQSKDIEAEFLPRISHNQADFAMSTQDGFIDLMISDDAILIQFTDRFLQKIDSEIQKEKTGDDNGHFKAVLLSMLSSGVTTLLDRAIAIPIHHIDEVYYQNGKLHIIANDGTDLFKGLEVEGTYVMENFSRHDARKFVVEAEKRIR